MSDTYDEVDDNYEDAVERPERRQPHRPKGIREPQDRKPKKKTAAQREAEHDETVVFEHLGVEFEIPALADELPGEVNEYFELSRISNGLRELFGAVKWNEYRKQKPSVKNDRELFNILAEQYGFTTLGD